MFTHAQNIVFWFPVIGMCNFDWISLQNTWHGRVYYITWIQIEYRKGIDNPIQCYW